MEKRNMFKEFFNINTGTAFFIGLIIHKFFFSSCLIESLIKTTQVILTVKIALIINKKNYFISIPFLIFITWILMEIRLKI